MRRVMEAHLNRQAAFLSKRSSGLGFEPMTLICSSLKSIAEFGME